MTEISFKTTRVEFDVIQDISHHAQAMFAKHGVHVARNELVMDITACHSNGCPLRLEELRDADDANFAHDVGGIRRHLDRDTGQLTDCFVPRFASRARNAA